MSAVRVRTIRTAIEQKQSSQVSQPAKKKIEKPDDKTLNGSPQKLKRVQAGQPKNHSRARTHTHIDRARHWLIHSHNCVLRECE